MNYNRLICYFLPTHPTIFLNQAPYLLLIVRNVYDYISGVSDVYCRILNEDDDIQFRRLRLEALQNDPSAFATTYERELNQPYDTYKKRLKHTDSQFVVGAFDDATLVCVASFLRHSGPKMKHKGMLLSMFCKPDYRGTGIAKDLVQYFITEVKKLNDIETLLLMVLSENERAKTFYRHFGFVKYGTEPRALFDGERYYDEDLMMLDVCQ